MRRSNNPSFRAMFAHTWEEHVQRDKFVRTEFLKALELVVTTDEAFAIIEALELFLDYRLVHRPGVNR